MSASEQIAKQFANANGKGVYSRLDEVDAHLDEVTAQLAQTTNKLNGISVHVTQPPYNAKGDGTTDDTQAIQQAIDDLSNGGTVFLPQNKTFIVEGLTIANPNISLIGGGKSTILKQKGGVTNKHIITVTGQKCIISNMLIKGDWNTVTTGCNGIEADPQMTIYNVDLEEINGTALRVSRSFMSNVRVYKTSEYGLRIGADSILNNIEISRTLKTGLNLLGGRNTVTGVLSWMCGNNGREDTNLIDGNGAFIGARGNTVTGLTIFASAKDGLVLAGSMHTIVGNSTLNGVYDNYNNNSSGVVCEYGISNCVIDMNVGNDSNLFDSDGQSSWGWQKYGFKISNTGNTYGNVINAVANNVDEPFWFAASSVPFLVFKEKNEITLVNENGKVEKYNSLPTPTSGRRGLTIDVLGGAGVADKRFVCIKNASDVYEWKEISFVAPQ